MTVKKDKIKRVCLYQSVQFGVKKSSETYFSSEMGVKNPVDISIFSDLLISIKNEEDHVMIPITNVKSIHFFNDSDAEREAFIMAEKKKKPTGKAQDIKRPR